MFFKSKTASLNDKFELDFLSQKVFDISNYSGFKITTQHSEKCKPLHNHHILENINIFKNLYQSDANMGSIKNVDYFLGSKMMEFGVSLSFKNYFILSMGYIFTEIS